MRRAIALLLLLAGCTAAPTGAPPPPVIAAPPPPAPAPVPTANPAVDGVSLPLDRLIADDIAATPSLSHFGAALAAAGLDARLREAGPFTVFAPTDEAWGRLQPGTTEALLKPENRAALTKLVLLHVVAGALTGPELARRVAAGGGRALLTSLAGEPLTISLTQGIVTLTDGGGNRSYVAIADVRGANGVVHLVNGVLVPRLN